MTIKDNIHSVRSLIPDGVTLVCVSKFHSAESIREAYDAGERDFGESRVQELMAKYPVLPQDIRWHFIGHLQTNKVRQIVPFVHLIQSIDSEHLLQTVNDEAKRIARPVDVLLEIHVAAEATKTGFSLAELRALLDAGLEKYPFARVRGIMGMATLTDDMQEIRRCFAQIAETAHLLPTSHPVVSMGMSSDFTAAIEQGSTMVRIGTTIFGAR